MTEKTSEQALAELNAVDDLRDKLITCYPSIRQRDADDAAEWAYEQIHAAVAAERERCCRDSCRGCAEGVPIAFAERPDGGVRPRPPTWIHWWECGMWTVCGAAAIRERARGGE